MNILLIAPSCFPIEGAESIVNIKMLQSFAIAKDIEVDLVSRPHRYSCYPSSSDINTLGVNVRSVYVVDSSSRLNFRTAWQLLMCLFRFRCTFRGAVWAYAALSTVKRLVNQNCYDFILTKNSPSFLLGHYFQQKGLKWVASWNDPFPTSYYPFPYDEGLSHKPSFVEKRILSIMRQADYHVFPTELLREYMLKYLSLRKDNSTVIPHVVLFNKKRVITQSSEMRIIHSGNLGGKRDPSTFFEALDSVIKEHPEMRFHFTILGKIDDRYCSLPSVNSYPYLAKHFSILPPVSYPESLQALNDYSLACVIEAPCNDGEGVFLPTKVTDFLQEGIPIIAISPTNGVLNGLYNRGVIGYFGDVRSVDSIRQALIQAWNDYSTVGLKDNLVEEYFMPPSVNESYRQICSFLRGSFE